ncbi:MAG: HAD family phosphatase [Lachnospiraceae bacterium]|jgi:putative hydrolase of the HAD superfamily|nr:HAD family phosphatase [Lachnospiraceae bacterium]
MIKNIVFDIGNVLTVFCWEKFFCSFGYPEEIVERIAKATALNASWNEYDRGVLSDEEVLELFIDQDPGIEKELREVNRNISGILERCDYAIPWIESLHEKGYKVYYLSNFFRKAEVECAHALDFIPHTDGGILSYKEKLIKPDEEIYQLLFKRFGLIPQECVFIDDRSDNCETAKRLGMKAICFQDQAQAQNELALLLNKQS